jgi:hypothetical protein
MRFLNKHGAMIMLIIAVVGLILNIRQTQIMMAQFEDDCGCKEGALGPL